MKKFLVKISLYIVLTFIVLEVIVRILNLHGDRTLHANINGDYLLKPGQKGFFVRGTLGEVRASFSINPQGFNSLRDYQKDLTAKQKKIALVGDSYIEGFHVNVENSIGQLLEKKFNQDIIVHEYGVGAIGFADYKTIYEKYNLHDYDLVFIFFTRFDLYQNNNVAINKPKPTENKTLSQIYSTFKSVQYLNQNHLIIKKIKDLFSPITSGNQEQIEMPNIKGENIFYVKIPLKEKLTPEETTIINSLPKLIKIKHKRKPYDFGFDYHWNLNGRMNAAESLESTINRYLQKHVSK
jgi:hypothetical protein